MKNLILTVLALAGAGVAQAGIHTETVEYKQGDTTLEGFVAYDDAITGKRPGILVVHQWLGLTDYEKHRAEMLAQLGYVAFCADIYGKGVRPQNTRKPAPRRANIKATGNCCAPGSMPAWMRCAGSRLLTRNASRPSAIVLAGRR